MANLPREVGIICLRADGYGSNYGEWQEDKKVAAIAVPVLGIASRSWPA